MVSTAASPPPVPAGPEQVYFADPALDRLMGVVFALAGEVHVLKDRLRAVESILAQKGVLRREELDRWAPSQAEAAELARERDAFVAHLWSNLAGRQSSKSEP